MSKSAKSPAGAASCSKGKSKHIKPETASARLAVFALPILRLIQPAAAAPTEPIAMTANDQAAIEPATLALSITLASKIGTKVQNA